MAVRVAPLALLLLVAACGGSEEKAGSAGTNVVADKAVADVDAAMADALRTRTEPPAVTKSGKQ